MYGIMRNIKESGGEGGGEGEGEGAAVQTA